MSNSLHGQETKRQLAQSLCQLMEHKPLEKITVREVTEQAGVNRQTFYYHFEDIYDAMKWVLQEEAVKLLAAHEGALFWQEGLLQLARYVEEKRVFCLNVFNSLGRGHLQRFLFADISHIIQEVIEDIANDETIIEKEKNYIDFLTHFFTVALAALTESWVRDELDMTAEQFIDYIDITLQGLIRGIKQQDS